MYAAGLIDGEGCLYVDRTLVPCLDVGMAQSAMPLLAKLKTTYGGSLNRFRPATEEWQAGWTWRLSGKPCAETLALLAPHMLLKERQARLLLELQALKDGTMKQPDGRTRWTAETRERAEAIRAEVKALNRRGPETDWPWPEGADAVLVGDRLLLPQTSLLSETGYEESSGTFPTSGLAWATGSLTAFSIHVTSACRSDADGCSSSEPALTEILQPPHDVPAKYSLSARAALGILRRAEKRGRTLPSHLQAALEEVART